MGSNLTVINETKIPLSIAMSQLGPLYWDNNVPPDGGKFYRDCGRVWFTVEVVPYVGYDNFKTWQAVVPIVMAVVNCVAVAVTALPAILAARAAIIGATELISEIELASSSNVAQAVATGGIEAQTAEIVRKSCLTLLKEYIQKKGKETLSKMGAGAFLTQVGNAFLTAMKPVNLMGVYADGKTLYVRGGPNPETDHSTWKPLEITDHKGRILQQVYTLPLSIGTFSVGSSLQGKNYTTVTISGPIQPTSPTVFCIAKDANNTSYPDCFTTSIHSVTNSQVKVNIARTDTDGIWAQNLQLDVLAVPHEFESGDAKVGTLVVGKADDNFGRKVVTIDFGKKFKQNPVLLLTARNENGTDYKDTFTCTIQSLAVDKATVLVQRVAQTGETGRFWAQQLQLDWFAVEKDANIIEKVDLPRQFLPSPLLPFALEKTKEVLLSPTVSKPVFITPVSDNASYSASMNGSLIKFGAEYLSPVPFQQKDHLDFISVIFK